jgi:hypothetical protein
MTLSVQVHAPDHCERSALSSRCSRRSIMFARDPDTYVPDGSANATSGGM